MRDTIDAVIDEPSVAVVSVTYNRCDALLTLLTQLREIDYPKHLLDVFLVDNASRDDTAARVRAEFPEVRLVESTVNTGISGGFNLCTQAALSAERRYKYLWLLDSDAEVEPQTLSHLVSAAERNDRIGVIGSAVYDPVERARLVTIGLRVEWQRSGLPLFVADSDSGGDLVEVDLIPACSLLTRSEICRRLGLWDLRFPLYCGDTDWCARVLRNGYRVFCHKGSRVWHRDWSRVQRGFGGPAFIRDHVRGTLLFNLRHAPSHTSPAVRQLLLRSYLRAALENLTMRHAFRDAYLAAVDDLLRGSFAGGNLGASGQRPLWNLDELVVSLESRLGPSPSVLLNQIEDAALKADIREAFGRRFPETRWEEIPFRRRTDIGWSEYRTARLRQIPELLRRLCTLPARCDVNVCDVSNPLLYSLAAGRYTMLVDASRKGIIEQNRVASGLLGVVRTGLRGLKATYLDVPRAIRNCAPLREAVEDADGRGAQPEALALS